MNQRHVIKKQIFEILTGNESSAKVAQETISQMFNRQLLPLINKHCDTYSSNDALLCLDSLEIDLGELRLEHLQTDLTQQLDIQIKKKLSKAASRTRKQKHGLDSLEIDIGELSLEHLQTDLTQRKKSSKHSIADIMLYYLASGRLPWWADYSDETILDKSFDALVQFSASIYKHKFRNLLSNRAANMRLIHFLDEERLLLLTNALSTVPQQVFNELIESLIRKAPGLPLLQSLSRKEIEQALWQSILLTINTQSKEQYNPSITIDEIISRFAIALNLDENLLKIELASHFPNNELYHPYSYFHQLNKLLKKLHTDINNSEAVRALDKVIKRSKKISNTHLVELFRLLHKTEAANEPELIISILEMIRSSLSKLHDLSIDHSVQKLLEQYLSNHPTVPVTLRDEIVQLVIEKKQPPPNDNVETEIPTADEEETIYINNSGLVIIWPFLERFFNKLDWLDNKKFRDTEQQQSALVILHYLATGSTSAKEFMLPLCKILCGLSPEDLFIADIEVREDVFKSCDELLQAIIENAPILKNTSLTGLREAFIKREGAIKQRDGIWLLQVEKQTHDIVLDRFPWDFSWVKLPWMPIPMRVEW